MKVSTRKKIFLSIWAIVLAGILILSGLFMYVAKTKMPDTSELENPVFEESSMVYFTDGTELDRYFSKNRQWVDYSDLSPHLINALISTEDHRYYAHSGVDFRGTLRAMLFLGRRGGGSTITQQLALQFFTRERSRNPLKRIWQKMKEWVIAVEFERRYTKEEIISMYLNKFDFIYGSSGVAAAATVYFGKEQSELSVDEAATLIGMLKNPYFYNPKINTERSLLRRNVVLGQMKKQGSISDEEYQEFKTIPMDMSRFNRGQNYQGYAPHFMAELKKHIRQIISENGLSKPGGEPYDIDLDGLRIYSTIDRRLQQHAEVAMKKHMDQVQKRFFSVWKGKDPWKEISREYSKDRVNAQLNRLVEQSERYQKLRNRLLDPVIQDIRRDFEGMRMWNTDIHRMIDSDGSEDYLDKLLQDKIINKDQKESYEQLMTSDHWSALKDKWQEFMDAVKTEFERKIPMRIYIPGGEVEVEMSPLDSIKYMSKYLQFGSVAIDPLTGEIRSWVGGTDFDQWKYDHVTSRRQVGSTFKPFLYTAAVMNGYSPCWKVEDTQYTIVRGDADFGLTENWSPSNANGTFSREMITLKDGLRQSLNSISVWLVKELGSVHQIIQVARDMGISEESIPPYPSIVLGTPTLSLYEMTSAYTTFANHGVHIEPYMVSRIETREGNIIYQGEVAKNRAIPENVNQVMVELLKYASSNVSWALQSEFGGKTGTTDDYVDGWYIGITPYLVVGTWVGGEYPWIRFRTLADGQGGVMARPFFLEFMKRVESDSELNFDLETRFAFDGELGVELDCDKYDRISRGGIQHEDFEDPFE
jgi:penicillin-binding protein 1A